MLTIGAHCSPARAPSSSAYSLVTETSPLKTLALILLLRSSLAFAFANVNVDAQPHVERDSVAHVEKGAVEVHGTATITGGIQPGAIQARGTIENGAFQAPLGTLKVDAPVTFAKDTVDVPVTITATTSPKTINVEAPFTFNATPNMIHLEVVIPADAVDKLAKPIQSLEAGLQTVAQRGENTLIYGGIGVVILALGIWWAVAHLKQHVKTQLEARQ